jgi:hypothetical protein
MRLKLSSAAWVLAFALVAYVVCDVLLTPPVGLETRNPARVTGVGVATLVLLFVGLALGIVALVLLLRGSRRAPIVAIIASILFVPAFLAEQTGKFSSLRPPAAIESIEFAQILVVTIAIVVSSFLLRRDSSRRSQT